MEEPLYKDTIGWQKCVREQRVIPETISQTILIGKQNYKLSSKSHGVSTENPGYSAHQKSGHCNEGGTIKREV